VSKPGRQEGDWLEKHGDWLEKHPEARIWSYFLKERE